MPEKQLLISQAAIAERVNALGAAITRDYRHARLLVIGVLNGAFIFMADLVRAIRLEMELDFIRVSSYGMDTSPGKLHCSKEMDLDCEGRDILIVEDIIDTGATMVCLKDFFAGRGARSVRVCALIDKKERRSVQITAEYVGFAVPDGFLVGYGMDCGEQYRHYPEIYVLRETSAA